MKIRFVAITALTLVAILTTQVAAAELRIGMPAPPFELKDQFGRAWRLVDLRRKVVVGVAVNQHSGEMIRPWANTLFKAYGSRIQPLGILDLRTYPEVLRGTVAARIRRDTNRSQPMLLDFTGRIGTAYEVSSRYPVVVVIDRRGVIRGIQKSVWTPKALAGARSAVDAALRNNDATISSERGTRDPVARRGCFEHPCRRAG